MSFLYKKLGLNALPVEENPIGKLGVAVLGSKFELKTKNASMCRVQALIQLFNKHHKVRRGVKWTYHHKTIEDL